MKNIRTERMLLLAFSGMILVFVVFSINSKTERMIRNNQRINILILGCDDLKYVKHSDVIMLASYEPRSKFLDVLSIPRDTKVRRTDAHWRPFQKINEVYARAYLNKDRDSRSACLAVKDEVEKLLKVKVPFYLQIDYNTFCDVIDVLGGVEIDVEKKMDYDDNWGNLHIHFNPGRQLLNGHKSLEYVRYREKALGDMGRISRQHKFLKLLSAKMKELRLFFKIPAIFRAVVRNVWTNMKIKDIMLLAVEMRDLSHKDIRIQNLPGEAENIADKSYWVTDSEKTDDIVNVINTSFKQNTRYSVRARNIYMDEIVTVEVWNASSREGLAKQLQLQLRKYGIDALRWGNYGTLKKCTTVIDRKGNLDLAYKIAGMIGCSEVKTEIDPMRLVDLSIVVGEDFKEFYEKED